MIYAIVLAYLILLTVIYDVKSQKIGRNLNYFISFLILFAIVAFRYRIGGDTLNYINSFEYRTPLLSQLDFRYVSARQPLSLLIFSTIKTIFNDFIVLQIIASLFVNSVVFWFISKNTKYAFTGVLLYAVCFYMRLNCEIMRESFAICFFLLGYRFLINRSYIKYYIFAFLAFMCHASAIFLFVLPFFISNVRWFWKVLAIAVLGVAVTVILPPYIQALLRMYFEMYEEYDSTIFGKLSLILFNVVIPAFFYFIGRKYTSTSLRVGLMIYIGCGIASLFFYILYRFNNYTTIIYIVYMASMLGEMYHQGHNNLTVELKTFAYAIVFCFVFAQSYFSDVSNYVGHPARWYVRWYPYYSIFNPQVDPDREVFIVQQFKAL